MNLSKKISLSIKDFLFQSACFCIVLLSPLGSLGWKFRVFETPKFYEIIYAAKHSSIPFLLSQVYYFILFYLGSIFYSAFPVLINTYFIRFNKFRENEEDYLAMKILLMFAANFFYLIAWMKAYTELVYRDLAFPIGLNLLVYLIWYFLRERRRMKEKTR